MSFVNTSELLWRRNAAEGLDPRSYIYNRRQRLQAPNILKLSLCEAVQCTALSMQRDFKIFPSGQKLNGPLTRKK